ncbi:MAG: ECF transporter S component [Clostridia bacterium]|nr:ECF transporter S component [Clostridia bacterium]
MTNSVRRLVLSAMCAALVFCATCFLHIPMGVGYIHLGDGCILLAGLLLTPYWAAGACGLASALADVTTGFAMFAPFSFVIKALMGLLAGIILRRRVNALSVVAAAAINGIIMVVGYFFTAWAMFNRAAALADVPDNLLQTGASFVIGLALCLFARKLPFFKEGGI